MFKALSFQPFPYQGSKRRIAPKILRFLHGRKNLKLVEPFAGSAAISLAAAHYDLADELVINDLNHPLIKLLKAIVRKPDSVAAQYKAHWLEQLGQEKQYYNRIRDEFNQTKSPTLLHYLLCRCAKASPRYNAEGEFNQSPDNRRKGMEYGMMASNLKSVSQTLRNRVQFSSRPYRDLLSKIDKSCVVYLDPPYQGVSKQKDPRYIEGISFHDFVEFLADLNSRNIQFIVSYDGRKGDKHYGQHLPKSLNLKYIEIMAGTSSQSTLLGKTEITYESLYVSEALSNKLPGGALEQTRQLNLK